LRRSDFMQEYFKTQVQDDHEIQTKIEEVIPDHR